MNLPNYFLADLPSEAGLTARILGEACETLKRNRERFLRHRTTPALVKTLSSVAKYWLEPEYHFRKLALETGSPATGFSRATLSRGLDSFFKGLTQEGFLALLEQDLGHPDRLDRFCSNDVEQQAGRQSFAAGPELQVHIAAGNVPSPALMSIVLGLVTRSAQFVKCASGTSWLPRLFAHSLYETDPKLGACIEVAEWKGGDQALEDAVFEYADCVTATGSDEMLASIRQRIPERTRFIGYGHRASFGYIAAEVLSGVSFRATLERAVDDIVAWNQLGCLSPHVLYVQNGGIASPELFAEALAEVLDSREQTEPRGSLPPPTAATIASRRSVYELRAAHNPGTRIWCSDGSTAWSVVYETDARFQLSCLHRFVYVKPVKDLTEALQNADIMKGQLSTIGIAAPGSRFRELAAECAVWGASRVCPLGNMQSPPLAWRHDGRPPLGELVTWIDLEIGRAMS